MFAFGESVERLTKNLAAERARIRKGKVWGKKRSVDLQTTDNMVLPDITSKQLIQNCETVHTSLKEEREGTSGKDRKAIHQIAKRGRLRDSTCRASRAVENLEGLFVSKLTFQSETEITDEYERKQPSRLSKTDSGFFDESGDELVKHSLPPCTLSYSNKVSNGSVLATPQITRKITMDFKAILNQNKTVVRNTDKLTARANMCLQSTQSLHDDLVAFRSLSTHHKGAISNCALQTTEHCVKLREVVLKTKTNLYNDGVKQSDTSLAVLKTRRRLSDKRNSCSQCVVDLSRATFNCKHHVQFAGGEHLDKRQCESCPVDLRAPQLSQDRRKSAIDISARNLDCTISARSGLTDKALVDISQSQEIVDVNVKCQEWLNRWTASYGATQTGADNYPIS